MKRLKIILNSKYLYIVLFLILIIYFLYYISIDRKSNISLSNNTYSGIVTNYKIDKELLTIEVKGNEKIIGYYYFKSLDDVNNFDIKLGDTVLLNGIFNIPNNNTVPNLFNYKNYLKHKHIYMTMNIDSIEKIKDNNNFFYRIKNSINRHIYKYKSKAYLETFILGNKNLIDSDTYKMYQSNGISHLFAISGMHITILSVLILFILDKLKIKKNISLILVSFFLLFYAFLTGLSASVERCTLLFCLLTINKLLKLDIKTIKLLLLAFIILVFIDPYILYDTGFIYSFTISFFLISFQDRVNSDYYIRSLFSISLISFLVSLPITLYNSFEINFLSIILNLFFVPFVSFIVFPLGLITFFIPIFDNIFFFIVGILEFLSNNAYNITTFKVIFGKVGFIFIISYYLVLIILLKSHKRKYLFLLIVILILRIGINYIPSNYVSFLDVAQGDSIFLHFNNKNILIDTGGKVEYKKENWMRSSKKITDTKTIPFFKSKGINKLDYLIISHGDYDHMGEAINLVNNFKVEKVIFNCGPYNNLEQELIKVLNKKKIKYYSCIKELSIDKNKLYFLQTKEYDNENDNSNVIYTELGGYKFMFMGDASAVTEKEIIDKYNLPDIDVLKVGHHGSKTSSSKEFIDKINPKYSIISVGKNNRYGHPNKEVLENLKDSKIYRTDEEGSILFEIKNNKLKIETCSP